jgi:hypothetical protein
MSDGFDTTQLDKFTKDLINLANQKLPKESKKFLKKEANKLNKVNKSVFNSKNIGEDTGNLKKSFKSGKVYKYNGDLAARAYNSSPHAHLIDQGWTHKSPDGTEKWIDGKHFMEDAQKIFEGEFYGDIEDWIDKMLEEEGL